MNATIALDSHLRHARRHDKQGNLIRETKGETMSNFCFQPTVATHETDRYSPRKQLRHLIIKSEQIERYYRHYDSILAGWELGTTAPSELKLEILESNPIIFQRYTSSIESEDR